MREREREKTTEIGMLQQRSVLSCCVIVVVSLGTFEIFVQRFFCIDKFNLVFRTRKFLQHSRLFILNYNRHIKFSVHFIFVYIVICSSKLLRFSVCSVSMLYSYHAHFMFVPHTYHKYNRKYMCIPNFGLFLAYLV